MTKIEAVQALKSCKPVYQNLVKLLKYTPTHEEAKCLEMIKQVFEADLIDDPEVMEAANLTYDEASWLVGYVFSEL